MRVPGPAVKKWVKRGLLRSGALGLAARMAPPSAAILMYHSVVEEPETTRDTIRISKSRRDFEAQMRMLAARYTPVTLGDIVEFARGGRSLPPRAVAVTFDDGFADNYHDALPVLTRYGVPAVFYLLLSGVESGRLPWYCRLTFAFRTTRRAVWREPEAETAHPIETGPEREAQLNRAWMMGASKTGAAQEAFVRHVENDLDVQSPTARVMLTWDQVRALKNAGHTIGAHTISHPNLAHVSETEAQCEIGESKRLLESALGEPVRHFSYPHPALNPCWSVETLRITREAGFGSAVVTDYGPVHRGDEPLALRRIGAASDLRQWDWNLQRAFLAPAR